MADPVVKDPEDKIIDETDVEESAVNEEVVSDEEEVVEPEQEDVLGMSDEDFEKQLSEKEEVAASTEEDEKENEAEVVADSAIKDPVPARKAPTKEPVKEVVVSGDPLQIDDAAAVLAYREMMKPFKANGKTVQARTPEEAIRLMQMGAGHIKYQTQVRPLLAQVKTLENAGITNSDLNFLVELHNKNPEAIKKLVRDADIDPYDIVVDDNAKEADKTYQPKNYLATEDQVALEEILREVQEQPAGEALLKAVRVDWDQSSRKMALDEPNVLRILTEQKQSGVYDLITAEIDRRRTLGEFANVPILTAYHQVGTEMQSSGAFDSLTSDSADLTKQDPAPSKVTPQPSKIIATKAAVPKQSNSSAAVKAIAPVKTVVAPKADLSNVMNMSDEEFAKIEGLEKFA